MALSKQEWLALEKKANDLRNLCLDTTYWAGSGHIGGGMSVMDMMTILYHKYLNIKVDDPNWEDRDRFILSKGHSGIAYAPVLVDKGFNDPEQLKTFNLTNSKMGIHLDSNIYTVLCAEYTLNLPKLRSLLLISTLRSFSK